MVCVRVVLETARAGLGRALLCFDDPPSPSKIPSKSPGCLAVATKAGIWWALNPFRASIAPLPICLFQFLPPPRFEHE